MRRDLIIGMFVLLAAAGVACGGPTPTPTPTPTPKPAAIEHPIEFVMEDKYALGEPIEIRIRNNGLAHYFYHRTYPACFDLKFYDELKALHQIAGKLFARRPLPPGQFIIPQGTHCDLLGTSQIGPGEEVTLLTWHQQECIADAWGCVESVQVGPGTYRVVGEFHSVGRKRETLAEWTFVIACGDGEDTASGRPTRPVRVTPVGRTRLPPPTIAPPTPPPCKGAYPHISVKSDALEFDERQLFAVAGTEVELVLRNASGVNQHNWVMVKAGTKDEVASAGIAAGPDNDWIPPDDNRIIASTRLLDPGETGVVRFTAPPAGDYQFVCTFPVHNFTMFGDFIVTP